MELDNSTRGLGIGYWHQFGTTIKDPHASAREAAIEAGLDYEVTKHAVMAVMDDGQPVTVPNAFAVMTHYGGEPHPIAMVKDAFQPIQNMHLADMLDASGLTGPNGRYGIDVAGTTRDGRTVFWALNANEEHEIAGDEYRDHWLLMDGKDGLRSLTLALTPVRVVCSNALALAAAKASVRITIPHKQNADKELEWWLSIAPKLEASAAKGREMLRVMASYEVTEDEVTGILTAAYPTPQVRGRAQLYATMPELHLSEVDVASVERAMENRAYDVARAESRRAEVRELFTSYADTREEHNIAGTALGVVNAVTDYENHRTASNKREDVALSNLYGPRYQSQARAMKATLDLVRG